MEERNKRKFLDYLYGKDKVDIIEDFNDCFKYVIKSNKLKDKSIFVLESIFRESTTLDQVGKTMGMSSSRVAYYRNKGISDIRGQFPDLFKIGLKDYLAKEEKIKEKGSDEISVDDLGLTSRTYNCVRRGGYRCLGDFKGKSLEDLSKIRNMGKKSLEELVKALSRYGIFLHSNRNTMDNLMISDKVYSVQRGNDSWKITNSSTGECKVVDFSVLPSNSSNEYIWGFIRGLNYLVNR